MSRTSAKTKFPANETDLLYKVLLASEREPFPHPFQPLLFFPLYRPLPFQLRFSLRRQILRLGVCIFYSLNSTTTFQFYMYILYLPNMYVCLVIHYIGRCETGRCCQRKMCFFLLANIQPEREFFFFTSS